VSGSEDEIWRDQRAAAQSDVGGRVGHRRCDRDDTGRRFLFDRTHHAIVEDLLTTDASCSEKHEQQRRERCRP
jgi:hypothetical protein